MHHIAVSMCHSLELPCVTLLRCHVASDTLYLEKRAIPTISEFDEIRRGRYISRENFNDEVRFVIRDLENFRFSTEITVLPFFGKIEFFFPGFTLTITQHKFFHVMQPCDSIGLPPKLPIPLINHHMWR